MTDEYDETPPKPLDDSTIKYVASSVREWERLKQQRDHVTDRKLHRTIRNNMAGLENDVRAVFDEHDLHELTLPDGRGVRFEPSADASGHISNWKMSVN